MKQATVLLWASVLGLHLNVSAQQRNERYHPVTGERYSLVERAKQRKVSSVGTAKFKARPTDETGKVPFAYTRAMYEQGDLMVVDSTAFSWYDGAQSTDLMNYFSLYPIFDAVNYMENIQHSNAFRLELNSYLPKTDTFALYSMGATGPDYGYTGYFANDRLDSCVSLEDEVLHYNYDANGNITAAVLYDASNSPVFYDSMTYDSNNRKIKHIKGQGSYDNVNEYVYDNNGKLVAVSLVSLDMNNITVTNAYTDSVFYVGGMDSVVSYFLNGSIMEINQISRAYQTGGLNDSVYVYYPNSNELDKYIYHRNAANQLIRMDVYYEGTLEDQSLITYNAGGDVILLEAQSVDNNTIEKYYAEAITYDNDGNLLKFNTYNLYDDGNNEWLSEDGSYEFVFYYREGEPAGVAHLSKEKIKLYPNPADDMIHISMADVVIRNITVLDISGRVMLRQEISSKAEVKLNISNLTNGNYIIQVGTDKGAGTSKFVKF